MDHPESALKLHRILVQVLGVQEQEISDTMSPATVLTWDSYNALMLVSELEREFRIKFTMDEIVAMRNVGDIKDALRRHNIEI